jgi:hypothetical protein
MSSHPDVIDSLHRLTDAAERASVVIYAIDPRDWPFCNSRQRTKPPVCRRLP